MAVGVPVPSNESQGPVTDEQLKERTRNLLAAAEQVTQQLALQNEQLAATISRFDREIVQPLREVAHDHIDR